MSPYLSDTEVCATVWSISSLMTLEHPECSLSTTVIVTSNLCLVLHTVARCAKGVPENFSENASKINS